MSYIRPGRRALSGVSSQPPGTRVASIALAGVTSQPSGGRVSSIALSGTRTTLGPRGRGMGLAFGDDITSPGIVDPLTEIRATTKEILERQKKEAADRRIALIIGGASALFAAAKLGILAIPLIRAKRTT